MKVFAILSILSISALAAAVAIPEPEANAEAYAAADSLIEKRADCKRILPICAAAVRIQRDRCPCPSQKGTCSLYACRGGGRVSGLISSFFFLALQSFQCCFQQRLFQFLEFDCWFKTGKANLWLAGQRLRGRLNGGGLKIYRETSVSSQRRLWTRSRRGRVSLFL